jgi:phosphinothricin acetyltransferase
MTVHDATLEDLPGILAIYNEVIANSTAVYSEAPVTLDDRVAWFADKQRLGYPVLVTRDAAGVTGFASFGDFRAWPCYRQTAELSVHIRADQRGQGIGRMLVEAIIARAAAAGKHVLVAGIDADNAVSIHLHERLGFVQVGHFKQVGRKFGRWLDLVFMQRVLDEATEPQNG